MSDVNFTMKDISHIASLKTLQDAKDAMYLIIENCRLRKSGKATHPGKLVALSAEINKATNITKLLNLATNMLLSGEGLGIKNSRYQNRFKDNSGRWIVKKSA